MKEGTFITKLVMVVMAAALAVYFGVYLWRGLTDPMVTTIAYAYAANDSVEADGFLVRTEQVLPARDGIVDLMLGEGEKVGQGQTVATVYRDDEALARKEEIRALELEIELLQYAMTQTDETAGTAELETNVVDTVVALRADTAAGEFNRLEERVMALKQALLKRDYTYGQGVDPARLSALSAQLRALQNQSAQETSQVTADWAGTFSAQVDGYETLITPERAAEMTPSGLLALAQSKVRGDENAVGKLITDSKWYFVLTMPQKEAGRLEEGKRAHVRFTGDFGQDVYMLVESISKPEEGLVAVLLSSDRYLAATTLLRQQTVEIIFETFDGLRVPKAAVRMEVSQSGVTRTGVYAVVNGRAEFKHVEILVEGSQFYVVRPTDTDRTVLRAGDEIITRARDLYDGKIVRG